MKLITIPVVALLFLATGYAAIIGDVRALAAQGNFAAAEKLLAEYSASSGKSPEYLEAYSWMGRGALNSKRYDEALKYAGDTRELALAELKRRPMDAEPRLPIAFGASSEVRAQALAATGQRSAAVAFLQEELASYHGTSIRTRLRKNLNLLTLEGKPAPNFATANFLQSQPLPLASYRGKPLLLFFWAHWCGDCKAQAPILAKLVQEFEPRGLKMIAPTRYYGYAARGEDAPPEVERAYTAKVLTDSYAMLARTPVIIDNETFMEYGASTTPTLVLVDSGGVVRLYRPGRMTYEELSRAVQQVLPPK